MPLSRHGKKLVAGAMYDKGRAFVGAAVLLDKRDGHFAVVLHLLCQGIEVILKALLLRQDYDAYRPRLVKLGHNLVNTAAAARNATGLNLFRYKTLNELQELDKFYRQHLLRYGHAFDIFIDPKTIPAKRVFRHCMALVSYLERTGHFQ